MPEPHRLPGLTRAEQDFVHHYLRMIDLLARINPAHETARMPTTLYVSTVQALVAAANELSGAVTPMRERGEADVFAPTLAAAVLRLGAERRTRRLLLRA